jgi:hypothetical protein
MYDSILSESIAYHKSIEDRKSAAFYNKLLSNNAKFKVIKDTILNKLSDAPWSNYVVDSDYFIKLTDHLRQAPS